MLRLDELKKTFFEEGGEQFEAMETGFSAGHRADLAEPNRRELSRRGERQALENARRGEASEGARLGLVVNELCGHQQVVVKSIEENYRSVPGLGAATILGNGSVAFILDIEKLPELARQMNTSTYAGCNLQNAAA